MVYEPRHTPCHRSEEADKSSVKSGLHGKAERVSWQDARNVTVTTSFHWKRCRDEAWWHDVFIENPGNIVYCENCTKDVLHAEGNFVIKSSDFSAKVFWCAACLQKPVPGTPLPKPPAPPPPPPWLKPALEERMKALPPTPPAPPGITTWSEEGQTGGSSGSGQQRLLFDDVWDMQ